MHLTSASVPAALALGVPRGVVVLVLAALLAAAIGVEIARRRSPRVAAMFATTFAPLLRARERTAVTGATWLIATMTLAVAILPRDAAIAATWAAAVGDALAALVGMRWGRHRSADGKSLEGSVACAVATTLGVLLLAHLSLTGAALCGVVAAVAERLPWPDDDNTRIASLVGAAAWAWRVTPY